MSKTPLGFESYTTSGETEMKGRWEEYRQSNKMMEVDTSVDKERLQAVLMKLNQNPTEISISSKGSARSEPYCKMVEEKNPVGRRVLAERAYATLVQDDFVFAYPVKMLVEEHSLIAMPC